MNERLMEIVFTQDGVIGGNQIMHRLFSEGWDTLQPLQYDKCCGHYFTTLHLPHEPQAGR